MQLNMQASPIGMASASQADFGGFDSRRLLHVSWIKMLSTAKTSENISFSEVFCCSGKTRAVWSGLHCVKAMHSQLLNGSYTRVWIILCMRRF